MVAETPGWPADRKRYTRPAERCGGRKAALRRNPKSVKRFQVSFRRLRLLAPPLQIAEIEVPRGNGREPRDPGVAAAESLVGEREWDIWEVRFPLRKRDARLGDVNEIQE